MKMFVTALSLAFLVSSCSCFKHHKGHSEGGCCCKDQEQKQCHGENKNCPMKNAPTEAAPTK